MCVEVWTDCGYRIWNFFFLPLLYLLRRRSRVDQTWPDSIDTFRPLYRFLVKQGCRLARRWPTHLDLHRAQRGVQPPHIRFASVFGLRLVGLVHRMHSGRTRVTPGGAPVPALRGSSCSAERSVAHVRLREASMREATPLSWMRGRRLFHLGLPPFPGLAADKPSAAAMGVRRETVGGSSHVTAPVKMSCS